MLSAIRLSYHPIPTDKENLSIPAHFKAFGLIFDRLRDDSACAQDATKLRSVVRYSGAAAGYRLCSRSTLAG
jgi:hypothetical protein